MERDIAETDDEDRFVYRAEPGISALLLQVRRQGSTLVFLTPKAARAKPSFQPEEEEEAENYFNGLAALYNLQSPTARELTYFEQLCKIHQANKLIAPQPIPIPNGKDE